MGGRSAPTVPRWHIGRELLRLRDAAEYTRAEAADAIGKSTDTVRNVELGDTSIDRANLRALLDLYVANEDQRQELLDLNESARRRGWWVPYAPGARLAMLLGVESVAVRMTTYSSLTFPGYLQTYQYAAALYAQTAPYADDEVRERAAKLQPERFAAIFDRTPAADVTALLDETGLRRAVAEPDIMSAQLAHVLDAPCNLRIVPATVAHPGTVPMALLETSDVGQVGYVERWRDGEIILDDDEDVQAVSTSLGAIDRVSLPEERSREMMEEALTEWRKYDD